MWNRREEIGVNHSPGMMKVKKRNSFKRLVNLSFAGICLALEIWIFTYFYLHSFYPSLDLLIDLNYWFNGYLLQFVVYGAMLFFFSNMYGGLKIGYLKNTEVVFSQVFATLLVNLFTYAQMSLMVTQAFVPWPFIAMTLVQTLAVMIWTTFADRVYKKLFPPRRLLVIHGRRSIEDIRRKFESRADKYIIAGCLQAEAGSEELERKIISGCEKEEYDAVVLWDISSQERNKLLKFCYAHGIRIYIMPKISDVILLGAEELHLFDTPILLTREYCMTMEQRFIKRCVDVICSLILLVIASPFMLITAIAIKLYDGGPVLYKQIRCTEGRREFQIMKFRSMRTDAEKDGVARLAKKNDDRITPIGRFIRKVRIDELPQLINIIKGDMSFIGPRPERPEIIAQYVEIMPEFAYRMKVKAGLAGYAQVYGKYNTTPYDKLKLDLTYIENYSLWLDLKLMLLTLKILFWPDSTEGVESEQITAFKEEYDKRNEKK